MLYTGGWDSSALGWATAENPEGPWVKHGVVLGKGAGGWTGPVAHHSVFVDGGKKYVFFPDEIYGFGSVLRVAVGRDMQHLHVLPTPVLTPPKGGLGLANSSVIRNGSVFRMMFESRVRDGSMWNMGIAVAKTPWGPYSVQAFPLPTLQRGILTTYGGPDLRTSGHGFELWYHAASGDDKVLPTDLYKATSDDLVSWKASSTPVFRRTKNFDQYADPVVTNGDLFFDGMNNAVPSGRILLTNPSWRIQKVRPAPRLVMSGWCTRSC